MTDERRKAAAEWCAEYGEGWSMKDYVRFSRQNVDLATMDAHLAGQECGEKRERRASGRWMMDGSDSPYDSSLDRMLDVYAARISKLESDLANARADLLLCNEANKECLRELSEAIADCKIVCHSYVSGGRPPQKIINRYLPKVER